MAPVLTLLLTCLGLVYGRSCLTEPPYPRDGLSAFIPFTNNESFPYPIYAPMLMFSIQTPLSAVSHQFEAAMDTGSTGLAISAKDLGLENAQLDSFPRGFEYLSSSRRLWEGYWINSNLKFADADVVAQFPILAVTQNSTCLKFRDGACAEDSKVNITQWPTGIKYMGVGFGRGSSEQPQALPDKVPFLNIASINGSAVEMYPGYVLSVTGIEVGLNEANTEGFEKAKLELRQNSTADDWQMVPMSISIDGSDWNVGQALLDTGISQSYVRVENETYGHLQTEKFFGSTILKPGSAVHMLIGDRDSPIATYKVNANDTQNPMNPYLGKFIAEKPSDKGPYINTGRHFYYQFDAMLDAQCGWFGLRKKDSGTHAPTHLEL